MTTGRINQVENTEIVGGIADKNQPNNQMGIEEQTNLQIALFQIQNWTIRGSHKQQTVVKNNQITHKSDDNSWPRTCSALVEEMQLLPSQCSSTQLQTGIPTTAVFFTRCCLLDVRAPFAQFLCETALFVRIFDCAVRLKGFFEGSFQRQPRSSLSHHRTLCRLATNGDHV